MRQFYCFLCCLLFLLPFAVGQNCLPNGIQFTSQRSIDSFRVNYPSCTIIEGDVEIVEGSSSSIFNLEGLSQLERINGDLQLLSLVRVDSLRGLHNLIHVGGNLLINRLLSLENFTALNNLQTIGGNFQISDNSKITDLEGLNRLKNVGGTLSIGLRALTNMKDLDSLQHVGSLSLGGNNDLLTLEGFNQLEKVDFSVNISDNQSLQIVNAFPQLDSIGSGITIQSNSKLEEVAGFEKLEIVGGNFDVRFNNILREITAFSNLKTTGGFFIGVNDSLQNLDAFQSFTLIDGDFSLSNNQTLTSIAGLNNLTTVNGVFSLNNHPKLLDLTGLEKLQFIERWLSIDRNDILNSIAALSNLRHISEGFSISYHPRLKTLAGLDNLPAADGVFFVNNNDSLMDISAIANLNPSSITEMRLRENPQLEVCSVNSICEFLEMATNEIIIIQNNAANCLDRVAVSNDCGIDYEPPIASNKSVEWDWASHIKRTSQNAQTFPTDIFHDSQNNSYIIGYGESEIFFNNQLLDYDGRIDVDKHSFIAKYNASGNLIWAKNENIGSRLISAAIDKNDIIHVFADDSTGNNIYFYEQYDTNWNQLSTIEIINYEVNNIVIGQHQIAVDNSNNPYFLFSGGGNGTIKFAGLVDTLQFPPRANHWVLKCTSEGEFLWLDTIRSNRLRGSLNLDFTEQNELTIAGTYEEFFSVQGQTLLGGRGSSTNIYCMQYTPEGILKWVRTFKDRDSRDYCNDLKIRDKHIYLTGTFWIGDYELGEDTVNVISNDPFLIKLDFTGKVIDHLVLPINSSSSKGSSIAMNNSGELVWIGKYSGNNALIESVVLPTYESNFHQEYTFLLTINPKNGLEIESIHTYPINGNYEFSELVPLPSARPKTHQKRKRIVSLCLLSDAFLHSKSLFLYTS